MLSADDSNTSEHARKMIRIVDTKLNVAAGNGLFKNQNKITYQSIQSKLLAARNAADQNNISTSLTDATNANLELYDAVYETKPTWRFTNIFAGPVWIYLISFLIGIFIFYYFDIDGVLSNNENFQLMAIYAGTWGCIGSILRGLWYLKLQVDKREYQNSWGIYFVSVPFLGGIFGVIVYFIIVGGLISISQEQIDVDNIFAILPFSALAGFNWQWAINLFEKIGDMIAVNKSK